MTCQSCIQRQRWIVKVLCRNNPNSTLCKKAKERLESMEGKSK